MGQVGGGLFWECSVVIRSWTVIERLLCASYSPRNWRHTVNKKHILSLNGAYILVETMHKQGN